MRRIWVVAVVAAIPLMALLVYSAVSGGQEYAMYKPVATVNVQIQAVKGYRTLGRYEVRVSMDSIFYVFPHGAGDAPSFASKDREAVSRYIQNEANRLRAEWVER